LSALTFSQDTFGLQFPVFSKAPLWKTLGIADTSFLPSTTWKRGSGKGAKKQENLQFSIAWSINHYIYNSFLY
jgi:hypothetical protein